MNIRTSIATASLVFGLMLAGVAQAQSYGPQDEGRRFNDGTVVKCHQVAVQKNSKDPNRVGGTVAGAVVGGLIGNQFGSGNGRKLATVGGAVAGGATGRYVQGRHQENSGDRVTETVCERR
jgi:outer membrane lipoprotein SlyB